MPNINGTNRNDYLVGGAGNDVINGCRGDDLIQGNGGDDVLTGGDGADKFVFHFDGGNSVITDFNAREGDTLVLDSGAGVYSGVMYGGWLVDGSVLSNHVDSAHFFGHAGDFDGDGLADDYQITCDFNGGSITLLNQNFVSDPAGVSYLAVEGWSIFGG